NQCSFTRRLRLNDDPRASILRLRSRNLPGEAMHDLGARIDDHDPLDRNRRSLGDTAELRCHLRLDPANLAKKDARRLKRISPRNPSPFHCVAIEIETTCNSISSYTAVSVATLFRRSGYIDERNRKDHDSSNPEAGSSNLHFK